MEKTSNSSPTRWQRRVKESTYQSACAILSWKWANKLNQHGFLQESKLLFAFYKLTLLCGQRNRMLNLKSLP